MTKSSYEGASLFVEMPAIRWSDSRLAKKLICAELRPERGYLYIELDETNVSGRGDEITKEEAEEDA